MNIYCYVWLCMAMYCYAWLCMYGYVLLCMAMYVWLCISKYVYMYVYNNLLEAFWDNRYDLECFISSFWWWLPNTILFRASSSLDLPFLHQHICGGRQVARRHAVPSLMLLTFPLIIDLKCSLPVHIPNQTLTKFPHWLIEMA